MNPETITREQWLVDATELLSQKLFNKPNRMLPKKLGISCGIPSGNVMAIGQCWSHTVSDDGSTQIFICPSQADPFEVLAILVHELCHAVVGVEEKHNKVFAKIARGIGLQGKLTATVVDKDSDLGVLLQEILEELPKYPHSTLNKWKLKEKKEPKPRVKLKSKTVPEYAFSMLESVLEEHGYPTDPWGQKMVGPEDEEDGV